MINEAYFVSVNLQHMTQVALRGSRLNVSLCVKWLCSLTQSLSHWLRVEKSKDKLNQLILRPVGSWAQSTDSAWAAERERQSDLYAVLSECKRDEKKKKKKKKRKKERERTARSILIHPQLARISSVQSEVACHQMHKSHTRKQYKSTIFFLLLLLYL